MTKKVNGESLMNFLSSAAEVLSESDDYERCEQSRFAALSDALLELQEEYGDALNEALNLACMNGLNPRPARRTRMVTLETKIFGICYDDAGAPVCAVRRFPEGWYALPPVDARYPLAGWDAPVTCIGDVTPEGAVSRYRAHLEALEVSR